MTLKLKHPFTLIVSGPSSCGKSTFVILCWSAGSNFDTLRLKILCGVSENNVPNHLKSETFVKGISDYENHENIPTFILLVIQLFTKRSHHLNISLVLITQNLFHQDSSSRYIYLNSNYIVVFKNPRDRTQIVHLARQFYPENISSFHKTYLEVCKEPHTYLFLDLTQSIDDLLRFRTKIIPGETTEEFAPVRGMNRLKSYLHFLHVLKNDKHQARSALFASASNDLIKAIVQCAINSLHGNHELSKQEKCKLSKYKNRLRALIDPKFSSKTKRNLLFEKGGFMFPLLTCILSGVIGTLINNN